MAKGVLHLPNEHWPKEQSHNKTSRKQNRVFETQMTFHKCKHTYTHRQTYCSSNWLEAITSISPVMY